MCLAAVVGLSVLARPQNADQVVEVDTTGPAEVVSPVPAAPDRRVVLPPFDLAGPLVLAGGTGVELVDPSGAVTSIAQEPVGAAYALGNDVVVFQAAMPLPGIYPLRPNGRIQVWSSGSVTEVAVPDGVAEWMLLDVGVVDGRPFALVAERSGFTPEDAIEELVLVDLDGGQRRVVVRRPAWESGHRAGRLLGDGDVVGLVGTGASVTLARWSQGAGAAVWSVEVAEDRNVELVLGRASADVIESGFDAPSGGPRLGFRSYDLATGEPLGSTTVEPESPEIDTGLVCRGRLDPEIVLCGRSGGAPLAIGLDGSVEPIPGPIGALVTVGRAA